MDIKKESLLNKEQYKCLEFLKTWGLNKVEFDENKKIVGITRQSHCDLSTREIELIMRVWQAAKAQAVPEGFVLVKKVHPDAIVHNQGLGLFKECQVIYGWDGKSKDFKDALNKGFYHGVKLGAKAVLETAMIEAQEPAND